MRSPWYLKMDIELGTIKVNKWYLRLMRVKFWFEDLTEAISIPFKKTQKKKKTMVTYRFKK